MKTDEIILLDDAHESPLLRMYHSYAQAGKRSYIEHHHTQLEISAVLSGSCEWQVRHQPFRADKGDIIILGSDEEHYITSIAPGEPLCLLNLQFEPRYIWAPGNSSFDSGYLGIFLNHDISFNNVLSGDSETAATVFDLLQAIYNEGREKKTEYQQIVRAELMLVLGLLGREYNGFIRSVGDHNKLQLERVDIAMKYINEHLAEELTLDKIAACAGLSRSYFSTVFKKLNGVSVWSYITGKRIELAMRLLSETDSTILEISGLCGFNNLANFNRSFKMIANISPSEYRRGNMT